MKVRWTPEARDDLARLRDFVAGVNPQAANRILRRLWAVPTRLLEHPRIGRRLDIADQREIRRVFEGPYEIRYEVVREVIYVLRFGTVAKNANTQTDEVAQYLTI